MEENKEILVQTAPKTDREMLEEINERLIRIEKRQRIESIRRWVTLGIVIVLIVALAAFIVPKVMTVMNDYNELMETIEGYKKVIDSMSLEDIDFSGLESAANALNDIDFGHITEIIKQLEEIDFDGLTEAVNRITSVTNSIGGLFG